MLLVFGSLPRPSKPKTSPTQLERQHAIEESEEEVEHEQARRCASFALRHPGGVKVMEIAQNLHDLPRCPRPFTSNSDKNMGRPVQVHLHRRGYCHHTASTRPQDLQEHLYQTLADIIIREDEVMLQNNVL